jgi:hypothetical protein
MALDFLIPFLRCGTDRWEYGGWIPCRSTEWMGGEYRQGRLYN